MRWPQITDGEGFALWLQDIKLYQRVLADHHGLCVVCGCPDCIFDRPCRFEQSGGILCMACGCARDHQIYLEQGSPALEPRDNMGSVPPVVAARTGNYPRAENEEEQGMKLKKNEKKGQYTKFPKFDKSLLPKSGKAINVKVLDFRAVKTEYSDYVMEVQLKGKTYVQWLSDDSVLLNQIIDELGDETSKWIGKQLPLYLAKEKYINAGSN